MKTRIVMWGSNDKDQKVLIAIGLKADENAVDIYTFPFENTTEEFYNLMLNEWRESHEVPFPEGFTHLKRPLTASDTILPAELKVDRADILQRAQTEWHFVVLSNKLYQSFHTELEEIKEKLKGADHYKNQLWEEMKESWEKIQKNIFDKTLLREHGQQLREMTNDIFTQLKNMRKDMDSEVDRVSRDFADKFNAKLDEVEAKIKSGLGLQPLFNDLKRLQQEFKDAQLSRGDRAKIWKRIDVAFKAVKEKKFGEKSTRDTSALDRLNRRYEGLMSAIDKMEKSIRRDDKDKHFQDDRIANTEGQLEAQIRMAKLKMIDERIHSKNEKLAEMLKTKGEIEERINREKKYLEDQKKQQVMKEELKEAKENVKQKIAETIHTQADQLDAEALGKAAEAIAQEKSRKSKSKTKESLLGAIGNTLGESLTDIGDSLGAVASVVADKIDDAIGELKEETSEKAEALKGKAQHLKGKVGEKIEGLKEDAQQLKEEVREKVKDLKEKSHHVEEEAKEKLEELKEKANHLKNKAEEKMVDLKESAQEFKEGANEKAGDLKESVQQVKEEVNEKLEQLKEKARLVKDQAEEKVEDLKEDAQHLAEEVKEKAEDLAKAAKGVIEDLKNAFTQEEKKEEWEVDEKEMDEKNKE